MGPAPNETLCLGVALLRLSQHSEDIRAISALEVLHVHLRCHSRRSLPFGDDCENLAPRSAERRESLPQKPLVHLRQLHGADHLGVGHSASPGDSRNRSKILVAFDLAIAETVDHDSLSPSVLEVFNAAKQNQPDLQVSLEFLFLII